MKYEVTYSCGHTGTVQLYGKTDCSVWMNPAIIIGRITTV